MYSFINAIHIRNADAVRVHPATDDVRLAQHFASVFAGACGHERKQKHGKRVGKVEVSRIAIRKIVGHANDSGRSNDDNERDAGDC